MGLGSRKQDPAKPVPIAGNAPTRKDVVIGPDGRWRTEGYVPIPVYTKKEPKPPSLEDEDDSAFIC